MTESDDEGTSVCFYVGEQTAEEVLVVKETGEIYVRGEYVETDTKIYEAMKAAKLPDRVFEALDCIDEGPEMVKALRAFLVGARLMT